MDKRETLRLFWADDNTRETVKSFFINQLEQEAIDRTMDREPTMYLADAKDVLLRSFDELDTIFSRDKKATSQSIK